MEKEERKKVLLIDDDRDFVETTKIWLETKYQVMTAYNGKEGMEAIKKERPNLILLDVMMPEKDGYVLQDELKKDPEYSEIPILLLTAVGQNISSTRYAKSQGMEIMTEDFIEKPIKPDELLARVAKYIK